MKEYDTLELKILIVILAVSLIILLFGNIHIRSEKNQIQINSIHDKTIGCDTGCYFAYVPKGFIASNENFALIKSEVENCFNFCYNKYINNSLEKHGMQ